MPLLWRKQAPVSCGEIQLKARPEPDIIKKTGEKAASMKRYIKDYDAETPIAVRLSVKNLSYDGKILNVPLFMNNPNACIYFFHYQN